MAFKSAIGEMCGFLRPVNSAADFRALGCKVWDQNANENAQWLANPFRQGEDDLGEIYGVQWRKWPAYKQVARSNQAAIELCLSQGYRQIADQARVFAPAQVTAQYMVDLPAEILLTFNRLLGLFGQHHDVNSTVDRVIGVGLVEQH